MKKKTKFWKAFLLMAFVMIPTLIRTIQPIEPENDKIAVIKSIRNGEDEGVILFRFPFRR